MYCRLCILRWPSYIFTILKLTSNLGLRRSHVTRLCIYDISDSRQTALILFNFAILKQTFTEIKVNIPNELIDFFFFFSPSLADQEAPESVNSSSWPIRFRRRKIEDKNKFEFKIKKFLIPSESDLKIKSLGVCRSTLLQTKFVLERTSRDLMPRRDWNPWGKGEKKNVSKIIKCRFVYFFFGIEMKIFQNSFGRSNQ